ncbi:MAG TPA: type IX secretion system membrane protein PorP/SprF [Cyclobacteriaceae bacterium]|nr:type IX secretion system membrane protein PorP/SprF [Cyclobacteriaceae bacterium]
MRKILLIIFFLTTYFALYAQQDPLISIYQFNQLMLNPAYAGMHTNMSLSMHSRAQWIGIEGAPVTSILSGHAAMHKNKVGAGAWLSYDQFGVYRNTEFYTAYSYKIRLDDWQLSMGVQGGITSYRTDFSKINLEYDDDPVLLGVIDNLSRPNFGAGVIMNNERVFFGLSVPKILNTKLEEESASLLRAKRHYYLSAGVVLVPSTFVKLKLATLMRMVEEQPASLDFSATMIIGETIWAGLYTRNLNTAGLYAQFEISQTLRAGYAFELAVNDLMYNNIGSHEIMLSLDLVPFSFHYFKRRYF